MPTGTIVPSSKVTSAEGSGPVLPHPKNKMFLFSAVNVSTTKEGSISPPEACIIPFGRKKENVEPWLVHRNCNWCKLLDQCQARNKMHAALRAGKDAAGVNRVRGCELVQVREKNRTSVNRERGSKLAQAREKRNRTKSVRECNLGQTRERLNRRQAREGMQVGSGAGKDRTPSSAENDASIVQRGKRRYRHQAQEKMQEA